MNVLTRARAYRRKIGVLLVVIALGFFMAIIISVPVGIMKNQETVE